MDSPNTMQNTSIGTYAGIGSVDCRPITSFTQPHSKIATMTPYAAPMDKRLSTAALVSDHHRPERRGQQEERDRDDGDDQPRQQAGDLVV